ncbi:MAG TPA: DNA-formamidopyrimidine glycosylase family protein [Chryseolinea sp.]|nr:DNA-formamidopyrimidine glycosylase family protein [Chryseolinea sp.]
MPEGPSIVLLKEALQSFVDKKIVNADGSSKKIEYGRLPGAKIREIKTWGKHLLICLPDVTIRIHLLMFGSYSIDTPKQNRIAKLSLFFARGRSVHFYACSVKLITEPLSRVYDWTADIMSKKWDSGKAVKKMNARSSELVCDILLDQDIFAGSGNIIKNETLFRSKIHPKSVVGKIPPLRKKLLVRELIGYSKMFLKWRRANTLKRHWLAYSKKICPRDHHPLAKEYMGKSRRRTFFCETCQKLYG